MYIDVEGHHSGGSSFINENDFCYYRNCLYNHRYKFSSKKEQVNESQYIVSRPDSIRIRHSGRIGDGGVKAPLWQGLATPSDFLYFSQI